MDTIFDFDDATTQSFRPIELGINENNNTNSIERSPIYHETRSL